MSTKIYLSVPFERKEDAKSLGAKWDKDKKLMNWYTRLGYRVTPYKTKNPFGVLMKRQTEL